MELLAAIRPDDEKLPLLLHVLGAMILVGGLMTATSTLAFARGNVRLLRLGYWSLLVLAFPGWISMFVGAEWIYREQGLADEPIKSSWVLVGFLVAELGGVMLLASLVAGGIGIRRMRSGKGTGLLKATMVTSLVVLAANVLAAWAMTAKPD